MVTPRSNSSWLEFAKSIQKEVDDTGVGRSGRNLGNVSNAERTMLDRFDEAITDDALRSASRQLFSDRHYARSVEEAFKCMNIEVRSKSGLNTKDGADLMREAFSANNPILRLNEFKSLSEKDEQRGYMDIYAGSMTGIRNPRAHEYSLQDDPIAALEMLTLANHLMHKLHKAKLD